MVKRNKAVIIAVISLFLLISGFSVYQFYNSLKAIMEPPSVNNEAASREKPSERETSEIDIIHRPPATFLIYGIDVGEWTGGTFRTGRGRADTIILLKVNFEQKTGSMLSIPRDTLVEIPGRGEDKINHAYAFGKEELLVDTVEQFTGVSIDYYVGLEYRAFKDIIDNLGGVEFEVDRVIQSRGLVLETGKQVLDGDQAFALISFRYEPMGDIARVKRQQRFVKAVANDVRGQSFTKTLSIVYSTWKHLDTNIPLKKINELVYNIKGIKDEDIVMEVVPGWFYNRRGVSYWKADQEKTNQIISQLFLW